MALAGFMRIFIEKAREASSPKTSRSGGGGGGGGSDQDVTVQAVYEASVAAYWTLQDFIRTENAKISRCGPNAVAAVLVVGCRPTGAA